MPSVNHYVITKTEAPTFHVNDAGHLILRYTVISSSDKGREVRRTYEIALVGAHLVKEEELKEKKELQP